MSTVSLNRTYSSIICINTLSDHLQLLVNVKYRYDIFSNWNVLQKKSNRKIMIYFSTPPTYFMSAPKFKLCNRKPMLTQRTHYPGHPQYFDLSNSKRIVRSNPLDMVLQTDGTRCSISIEKN